MNLNKSKQKTIILYVGIISFLIFYIIFYIRNSYFNENIGLYAQDMYRLNPISNDLFVSTKVWPEVLRKHTLSNITANIYSPLAIIIYGMFEHLDFFYVRVFFIVLTVLSFLGIVVIVPRLYNITISDSYISIFFLSLIPFSYGLRFEIERGQINIIILFLTLISIYLIHCSKYLYLILGLILLSFSIHMKVWPVFLIICIFNKSNGFLRNIVIYILFILLNLCLLFLGGYTLLKNYVKTLIDNVTTLDNAWMANMSLFSFLNQYRIGYSVYKDSMRTIAYTINNKYISYDILKIIIYIIFVFFIITIFLTLKSRLFSGNNIIIIYLGILLSLLIPNISYDYKLVTYYIVTPLFLAGYKWNFSSVSFLDSDTGNKYCKCFLSSVYILEFISLLGVVFLYPATLFSYILKMQYTFFLTINTTGLVLTFFFTTLLLFLNVLSQTYLNHKLSFNLNRS